MAEEAKVRSEAKRPAPVAAAPRPKRPRIEDTTQWRVVPRNLVVESAIYNYPLIIEGEARIYVNAQQLAVYSPMFLVILQNGSEKPASPPKFPCNITTWYQVIAMVEEGCTQGPSVPTDQFFTLLEFLRFKPELITTLITHLFNTKTPLNVPAMKIPPEVVRMVWSRVGKTHVYNLNFMRLFMSDTQTMMEATAVLNQGRPFGL
jgi:hypothetical protein